jgi:hypothetical protein
MAERCVLCDRACGNPVRKGDLSAEMPFTVEVVATPWVCASCSADPNFERRALAAVEKQFLDRLADGARAGRPAAELALAAGRGGGSNSDAARKERIQEPISCLPAARISARMTMCPLHNSGGVFRGNRFSNSPAVPAL